MGARSRWGKRVRIEGFCTDMDVIPSLYGGLRGQAVEPLGASDGRCARFSTIHRPNYYFNPKYDMNSTSSGESEKP